ncbi:MAG: response regulator transcription factor [Anaerolineae bacterium]|nr:response regulator transcription factor [Gloeobacterales cyanobacterium ES-bin-313]
MKILLVEDECELALPLKAILAGEGHSVDWVDDGKFAWEMLLSVNYDLCIFDWLLPGMTGIELTKKLRQRSCTTPVLLLTARDAPQDKVVGLDSGADDYLVKPFDMAELLARVRALSRRIPQFTAARLTYADLELDTATMMAYRGNQEIPLNRKEFQLLELFLRHPGQVLSRDQILTYLWEVGEEPESNVIAAQIRLLRRKIDEGFPVPLVHTVYGVGYRMSNNA